MHTDVSSTSLPHLPQKAQNSTRHKLWAGRSCSQSLMGKEAQSLHGPQQQVQAKLTLEACHQHPALQQVWPHEAPRPCGALAATEHLGFLLETALDLRLGLLGSSHVATPNPEQTERLSISRHASEHATCQASCHLLAISAMCTQTATPDLSPRVVDSMLCSPKP